MDISRFSSLVAHKNLIASAVVALVVIGVGVYFNQEHIVISKKSAMQGATTTQKVASTDDLTSRDSDKDGLLDWEERLNGSNPFSADTDGDGTKDGDELAQRRDPLKKGPNDALATLTLPSFATSSTDLEGIKKEFFAKYLANASREIRETTYRDLISGFDKKKFTPTNEILDLNITSDASPEALHAYGNAFGVIMNKYTAKPLRTADDILAEGLQTKDDESLKDLQYLIVAYRNFSRDLRALPVPQPLADHHLKIVNGYDGMSRGLMGMLHLFSDPINGAAGYQTYTRLRLDMILGYAGVVAYLQSNNVTFAPDEPGYPFVFTVPTSGK